MISKLLWYLILHQMCTYGMFNRIINPSNNICIVCFSEIYQSSITIISIPRFHKSSSNISPHLFTLKKISHHITPIRIILSIQPHTHRLKWIITFNSHNQQAKKQKTNERKTKYHIVETKKRSSQSYMITLKRVLMWIRKSCVWD